MNIKDMSLEEILSNPEALAEFKRETLEDAKKRNPQLTDAQLEATWEQALSQMG